MNSEWERLTKARKGDETAWRDLVQQYQPRLMSLALLITGSSSSAEDVVQETFMRAFRARINHSKGTVQGFLGTIAYRLALKELKSSKRSETIDNHEITDNNRSSLDNVLLDERDRQIAEAIRGLDDKYRDVLVLRFYADHSYDEIADLLQIPLGTVKSRIFNAVKTCRMILKDKGILS